MCYSPTIAPVLMAHLQRLWPQGCEEKRCFVHARTAATAHPWPMGPGAKQRRPGRSRRKTPGIISARSFATCV